jgi:hypothetical protein
LILSLRSCAGLSLLSSLQYTGKASIRQRRLPAEQAVWLVIALARYRHKSISEVVDDLDLARPDLQAPFVSKSGAAQARQRLGAAPLKAIFELSTRAYAEQDSKQYLFKRLNLFQRVTSAVNNRVGVIFGLIIDRRNLSARPNEITNDH